MEVTIRNESSRILIERIDNGAMIYEVDEQNQVVSKVGYELYFKDGLTDFNTMGIMLSEIMELLGISMRDLSSNRQLNLIISKIDPEKEEDKNE
jgi:hypothetical protein